MDKKLAAPSPISNLLPKLDSWEDFLSAFYKLTEYEQRATWYRADLLLELSRKFGMKEVSRFANDVGLPPSTLYGWIRTARAFPMETREPMLPFTAHANASYTDSYDETTDTFSGEERFKWIKKASQELLSSKELRRMIEQQRRQEYLKAQLGTQQVVCSYCGKNHKDNLLTYSVVCENESRIISNFDMHQECMEELLQPLTYYRPKEVPIAPEQKRRERKYHGTISTTYRLIDEANK